MGAQDPCVPFENVYDDARRAESYARLEFAGTYFLAFRDLPSLIAEHVRIEHVQAEHVRTGHVRIEHVQAEHVRTEHVRIEHVRAEHVRRTCALDFGCGTGRSTRFLRKLGFNVAGVDIAGDMVRKALDADPEGDYRIVEDGDLSCFEDEAWDLALSAFTFDNIPTARSKEKNLRGIRRLLKSGGIMINLVSSPEIYTHEWASFSTRDYPENRNARCGDRVRIVMTDVEDRRPVKDVLWTDDAYRELYDRVGFEILKTHKPLASESEPYPWVSETRIAPWVIYVLRR